MKILLNIHLLQSHSLNDKPIKSTVANNAGIINKLVMVFAFTPATKTVSQCLTNPDRATAVNKITIPG